MTVITIREQSQTEKGFNATLVIEGNNYSITVSDPFEAKEEQELEWYFEEWLSYPMLDNVKADKAKDSIKKYGEELFKQVFQADIKAYSKYSQLRNDLSKVQIEIESITPEFHAIHWEALQDEELPRPFAIDSVLIRKSVKPAVIKAKVNQFPTINLLVVTARPNAESDVGYRTISRPLVKAIRNAKLRVNIELLRPGTYEALSKHLGIKGSGYYHIVHFDVHGSLQSYEIYQKRIEIGMYPEWRYGREEIKPYEGVKAFLALEGNEKGEYDPVEASEIADLLTSKNIPICILNACQSGKQLNQAEAEDNRETSLGSRLMNAGMQMVVAMSYSVTVTAAEIIMEKIYEHLFDNQDINQAIRLGREKLYQEKKRKAAYNTDIKLEDWILPVVYSNGEVAFNLREFTPQEEKQYKSNLKTKYNFTEPTYGFVGRDIDILFIEKALLRHNILLLRGMAGTGKTTLLNYLQEWWQVTKFAEDIFYFAYDKTAYTLKYIIDEISKQLYNQFDFEHFKAKKNHEQCQQLSNKLRAESHILILDNLESITGKPLATQNTLGKIEKGGIKKFLAALVGGKTKVVLGSRIGEDWLKESTFRDNIYQLRGLDAQARTDLAEKILQKANSSQSLEEIKTDEHFQRLIKLLGGNPLAMEDILIILKDKSSEEILQFLDKGQIEQLINHKTKNSLKCIDSSYQKLSDSSQKLLLLLAPFRGFICSHFIYQYAEELTKLKIFHNYNLNKLEDAITEAISWGLLCSTNKDEPKILSIQPVLPHFLHSKLKEIDNQETRESLKKGFKNYYRNLSYLYARLIISENPREKQWGRNYIEWEYKNIYQSLQIALKEQESILSFLVCLRDYLILTNNQHKKLRLLEEIHDQYCDFVLTQDNKVYLEEKFLVSSILGDHYISNKNYQQAKLIFQENLNLILRSKTIEKQTNQGYSRLAGTYYELGRVNQYLKQFQLARYYYNESLKSLGDTDNKDCLSIIYNQLGLIAQDLREYKEAKNLYQKSLELIKQDSHYFQAGVFHNLGWVNEELGEFDIAIEEYHKAIEIYDKYHDVHEKGDTYHQLGNTFYKLGKYHKAKEFHQKALDIYVFDKDDYNQAKINEGLGLISQKLEDYEQAYDYYWKAYNIYKNKGDSSAKGRVLNLLGSIFKENKIYKESQIYYQESLDRYKENNDYFSQAVLCYELGFFSQELGEIEEAQDYYQRAFLIFPENGDHLIKARICNNLGMITQDLEQYEYAEECYIEALDILSKHEEHYYQTSIYNNLGVVANKLSEFEKAKTYYLQELELYVEFEEKQTSSVTIKNLARLYQKTQDDSLIAAVAAILNMTKAEVKELFDQWTSDN